MPYAALALAPFTTGRKVVTPFRQIVGHERKQTRGLTVTAPSTSPASLIAFAKLHVSPALVVKTCRENVGACARETAGSNGAAIASSLNSRPIEVARCMAVPDLKAHCCGDYTGPAAGASGGGGGHRRSVRDSARMIGAVAVRILRQ